MPRAEQPQPGHGRQIVEAVALGGIGPAPIDEIEPTLGAGEGVGEVARQPAGLTAGASVTTRRVTLVR